MQTGTRISASVHGAVLAWVLVGGTIFRPSPPDPAPMAVTVMSSAAYDAMVSETPAVPVMMPAPPDAASAPEPAPSDPARSGPLPDRTDPPARPEVTEAAAPVIPTAEQPQPAASPDIQAPAPPDDVAALAPADRVAPAPRPAPAPDLPRADIEIAAAAPAPDAAPVQVPQSAAAPEAAAPRIVTEADQAPASAPRPPARPAALATAAPVAAPDPALSLEQALAAAGSAPAPASNPAASQLSSADIAAISASLGDQIATCTNIIALPFPARRMTIAIDMRLDPDGAPVPGSLRLNSFSDGSADYAQIAFVQLSKAIQDCGRRGFDIPAGSHAQWGNMTVRFPLPAIAASIGEDG